MLASILKMVHVFAALWMIAGLVGRYVALLNAERTADIAALCAILPVANVFEERMVIPGSIAVLIAGLSRPGSRAGRC